MLAVLCLVLVGLEPIAFALQASRLVPRLATHDPIVAIVLVVRVAVAGLGLAAGAALWSRRQQGVALARAYFVLASVLAVVLATTAILPSNRPPGTGGLVLGLTLAHNAFWLVYLRRVRFD